MKSNNSILKTILVSLVLCLVCSSVISYTAISLREKQEANVLLDKQETILAAAGLLKEQESVDQIFSSISEKIVNLDTGKYDHTIDLSSYNQKDYSNNELTSKTLVPKEDIAVIGVGYWNASSNCNDTGWHPSFGRLADAEFGPLAR